MEQMKLLGILPQCCKSFAEFSAVIATGFMHNSTFKIVLPFLYCNTNLVCVA
ncbi:unnamed protein product [Lupinus luteus]|uniref:Uncharacterized protein n=1 Tax=Lupinus luteus TaxID=3873 RepID=A0AAV1XUS9_LUPLU